MFTFSLSVPYDKCVKCCSTITVPCYTSAYTSRGHYKIAAAPNLQSWPHIIILYFEVFWTVGSFEKWSVKAELCGWWGTEECCVPTTAEEWEQLYWMGTLVFVQRWKKTGDKDKEYMEKLLCLPEFCNNFHVYHATTIIWKKGGNFTFWTILKCCKIHITHWSLWRIGETCEVHECSKLLKSYLFIKLC